MDPHATGLDGCPDGPSGDDAADLTAWVADRFRARGERMTAPRTAVLAALASRSGHLTADKVVEAVAELDPSVHRSSVYRALEALVDLGAVQHLHLGHGATVYHLAPEGHHPHAQCRRCGQVFDLPPDSLDAVAAGLRARLGFCVDAAHVALSGVCAACAGASEVEDGTGSGGTAQAAGAAGAAGADRAAGTGENDPIATDLH